MSRDKEKYLLAMCSHKTRHGGSAIAEAVAVTVTPSGAPGTTPEKT
jgi:hypothetical protein